jgi:hypothetical protein
VLDAPGDAAARRRRAQEFSVERATRRYEAALLPPALRCAARGR